MIPQSVIIPLQFLYQQKFGNSLTENQIKFILLTGSILLKTMKDLQNTEVNLPAINQAKPPEIVAVPPPEPVKEILREKPTLEVTNVINPEPIKDEKIEMQSPPPPLPPLTVEEVTEIKEDTSGNDDEYGTPTAKINDNVIIHNGLLAKLSRVDGFKLNKATKSYISRWDTDSWGDDIEGHWRDYVALYKDHGGNAQRVVLQLARDAIESLPIKHLISAEIFKIVRSMATGDLKITKKPSSQKKIDVEATKEWWYALEVDKIKNHLTIFDALCVLMPSRRPGDCIDFMVFDNVDFVPKDFVSTGNYYLIKEDKIVFNRVKENSSYGKNGGQVFEDASKYLLSIFPRADLVGLAFWWLTKIAPKSRSLSLWASPGCTIDPSTIMQRRSLVNNSLIRSNSLRHFAETSLSVLLKTKELQLKLSYWLGHPAGVIKDHYDHNKATLS